MRRRLLDALDAAIERPLTLLAAPPGAGRRRCSGAGSRRGGARPVAWLSLDAADGERRRFWRAVLEALMRARPAGRPDARSPAPPTGRAAGRGAGRRDGRRTTPIVLVLDDFHEVAGTIHADLELLLRHPLPGLRLVVASRADPPLHLGRLRLQDQLTEIRAPDLALHARRDRRDDGRARHRDRGRRRPSPVGAHRGLGRRDPPRRDLAARPSRPGALRRRLRGRRPRDQRLPAVGGHGHGVGRGPRLPAAHRRSSACSTATSRTCSPAATTVTGGSAELARGGALLAPLDRRGIWYRYHALFAELLRAELRSEAPRELADLHRRAASWLADHGDDARGLLHAVEAGAWDLAARLAGERWIDLLIQRRDRGTAPARRSPAARAPGRRPRARPGGGQRDARPRRRALGRGAPGRRRARARPRARRSAARASTSRSPPCGCTSRALRGDLDAALEAGRELARRGRLEPGVVETDLRALALTNLGIAELWAGDLEDAERQLERGRGAAAEAGREWLVLIALAHLAMVAGAQDDYARAARQAREAIALAEQHGWERTWPAGGAYLALDHGRVPVRPARGGRGVARARAGRAGRHARAADARGARAAAFRHPHRPRRPRGRAGRRARRRRGARATGRSGRRSASSSTRARRCCAPSWASGRRRLSLLTTTELAAGRADHARQLQLGDGEYTAARATLAPWMPDLERRALAGQRAGLARRRAGARRDGRSRGRRGLARAGARPRRAERPALGAARLRALAAAAAAPPAAPRHRPRRARRRAHRRARPRRTAHAPQHGRAAGRAAQPARARGAALPADDDVQPGDRRRAVRLRQHGQDPPEGDLPQARRAGPPRGGPAGARDEAARAPSGCGRRRTSISSRPSAWMRSIRPCSSAWSRTGPCSTVSTGSRSLSIPSKLSSSARLTRPLIRIS